jgi:hypothetical protein
MHVPSILVVLDAAWPVLFARCLSAAVRSGVLVHRCEVAAAATFAAERRPVAIVLSNAVYALDPDEFDALARDVRATLLKVDEEVSERELEAMFAAALRERDRRQDDGGRYAIIRQMPAEEALPRPSQPPPSVRPSQAPPSVRSTQAPPSVRSSQAPPSSRSFPPPSARSSQLSPAASQEPPPSRSFAQRQTAPPSVRSAELPPRPQPAPSRSMTPAPGSLPPPPSVRGAQLSQQAQPGPSRSMTPAPGSLPPPPSVRSTQLSGAGPASVRSGGVMGPPPVKTVPPSGTHGEPQSGVRQFGRDALDAVFEEHDLPHEAGARGRRGSAT